MKAEQDHRRDRGVEQSPDHHHPREDLQREHDPLDEVDVLEDERRRPADAIVEQPEDDEAGKQDEGELAPVPDPVAPPGFEDDAEDEGEDNQQHEGGRERPQDAEHRPPVARQDLLARHLPEQIR